MRSHRWTHLVGIIVLLSAMPLVARESTPEPLSLTADGAVGKPSIAVVDRTETGLVMSLEVPSVEASDVALGDGAYRALALPGGGHRGGEGQPALPTVSQLVALPAGARAEVRVVARDMTDLGAMRLAPNLGIDDASQAGPVQVDRARYAAAPASDATARVGEPASMHGLRVVPVTFSPVAHDPRTGRTSVARSMTVEVTYHDAAPGARALDARMIPESFDRIFQAEVAGYQRDADVVVGPGSYVVICPNNASVVDALQPLLEWRRRQGYNVVLATTAEAGSTNSAIKSWLQTQYSNLEPALEFVVLVGDADGSISVPSWREGYSGYSGEGDHSYVTLDGGDVLADAHVGRLSVTSTTQLQTVVAKIVDYESEPDMSDPSWFTTAGLTGDPSSSGMSCIFVNQFVKEQLLNLGYTQIDTIFGGNYLTQMMTTIGQGETLFTYRGYLNMSGMSTSHINSLNNGRQLPFACILTCDTGSFWDDTTCRSEAFLRAPNGGGIASIGTATWGTHTRYNNCMFLGIMNGVLNSDEHRVGPSLTRGKINLYNNYWDNEWQNVWVWSTWNNLMGDPATEIFTGVPADIDVDYPAQLALGANALPVTVTDGGAAVAGARVAVYQEGSVSSFAYTDQTGQAVLDVAGAASGDLLVTVTGTNLRPHLGAAAVGPVDRSLDFASLTVQDTGGNADGFANPGETMDLQVALTNHGTNTVTGATATLAGSESWVTLLDADATYGTVAPGATVTRTFRIRLEAGAVGGAVAPLRLDAAAGAETWTSLVDLVVHGARGSFNRLTFGGPGGDVDPGESGSVSFDLANVGNLAAAGVTGTLSCNSQWVTVTDGNGSWGPIGVGGAVAQADGFAISVSTECYPGHLAPLEVELAFDAGGTQTLVHPVVVGTAGTGDPTGPDSYGYYAFDDGDDAPEAPTYDWVEIAGIGQNTGIADNGGGDDETRSFDLPFTFTYYGEDYDRVSICSNGWLALGDDTNIRLYRNWMLPADGSPRAMIAAFWDDLANGSVYTYHDQAEHRYIVQWDAMESSTNSGHDYFDGNCTFEIILYDPAHHATDSGDGRIEMQYQSVSVYGDETTYFTVGVQNEPRDAGLTYVYGNNYPGGSATVQSGRAIAFVPVVPQAQGVVAGTVTNASAGGTPVEGAVVSIVGSGRHFATSDQGDYQGNVPVGTWDVAVHHDSFAPDTTYGVTIGEDQTTEVDFALEDVLGPYIEDTTILPDTEDTGGPYVVQANITDLTGVASYQLVYTSSATGGPHTVPMSVVDGATGLVEAGIPGQPNNTRVQYWITATDVLGNGSADPLGAPWPHHAFMVAQVTEVASDECESAGSWQVDPQGNDTASTGEWTHGDPIGTYQNSEPLQPENDHTPAPGVNCWFTGQGPVGGSPGDEDVDGGDTTLDSPVYDVTGLGTVEVSYWRWYSNDLGDNPGGDVWRVQVSGDGGFSWSDVENTTASNNAWQQVSFVLNDHVANPDQLQLRFRAADEGGGSLVEAAVDDLLVLASTVVADVAAPTVSVQSPSGGTYANGMNLNVGWTADDDVGVVHADVWLSLDGGATYDQLIGSGPLDGALAWTVDVPIAEPSYPARIRVDVFDGQERTASAESAPFTIEPGTTAADDLPAVVTLAQNHPNPFNPQTVIRFSLPDAQTVSLRIYDVQGRLVRTLVDGDRRAGMHEVTWYGRDDRGGQAASGLYFYRLRSRDGDQVRKMTLLK